MKTLLGGQRAAGGGRRNFFLFCLLLAACCALNCSIPNLEEPECTASRGAAKEFYSYHFAGEMRFSPANLKQQERFLTTELYRSLESRATENDVFTTNSSDFPKAFRIGGCQVVDPAKTSVEIVLFWKDDQRTEQQTIRVEMAKENDKWLINKILN